MQSGEEQEQFLVSRGYSRESASVPVEMRLRWGRGELERVGIPQVEARWLLEWALGAPLGVRTHAGIRAAEKYRSAISQRRSRVPFQYITGEMSFRYLTLKAGPGVFVTRPETETLVDLAPPTLEPGIAAVADPCPGSGASGVAVDTERSHTQAKEVQRSPAARTRR